LAPSVSLQNIASAHDYFPPVYSMPVSVANFMLVLLRLICLELHWHHHHLYHMHQLQQMSVFNVPSVSNINFVYQHFEFKPGKHIHMVHKRKFSAVYFMCLRVPQPIDEKIGKNFVLIITCKYSKKLTDNVSLK
jgi:hypothetical protein